MVTTLIMRPLHARGELPTPAAVDGTVTSGAEIKGMHRFPGAHIFTWMFTSLHQVEGATGAW